jgi:hypothetical protein
MSVRLARAVFLVAAGACLGQAEIMSARLPAVVASHFGASGAPNAWMPRRAFVAFYALVVVFTAASLLAGVYATKRLPDERINLPNKGYWLAPERRAASLAFLEAFMLWFGAATFLLLFDVFRQVFRMNMGLAPVLEHPQLSLAAYAAFTVVWLSALLRRFGRVPTGA